MTMASAEKRAETAMDLAELCYKAFDHHHIGSEIAALAHGEDMTTARVYAALAEITSIFDTTNYASVESYCEVAECAFLALLANTEEELQALYTKGYAARDAV